MIKETVWESAEVIMRFKDGSQVLYNPLLNQKYHFAIVYPDGHRAYFEAELEAVECLVKTGHLNQRRKHIYQRRQKYGNPSASSRRVGKR